MRVYEGYATSNDGSKIFYQVIGDGPTIFCCNGLGVPRYFWRHLVSEFANDYRIISWDYRGHGKSPLPKEFRNLRYSHLIDDARAVIDELDIQNAIGVGHSSGFQILLGLYAEEPERFSALTSVLGTYGKSLSGLFDNPASKIIPDLLYVASVFWPKIVQLGLRFTAMSQIAYIVGGISGVLNLKETDPNELQIYLDHISKLDPLFFATLLQAAEAHSAVDILPTIQVPTLLIAAESDQFVPRRITDAMNKKIKNSELHILPGGSHAALFERPHQINQRLGQFFWRHRLGKNADSPAEPQHESSGQQ